MDLLYPRDIDNFPSPRLGFCLDFPDSILQFGAPVASSEAVLDLCVVLAALFPQLSSPGFAPLGVYPELP